MVVVVVTKTDPVAAPKLAYVDLLPLKVAKRRGRFNARELPNSHSIQFSLNPPKQNNRTFLIRNPDRVPVEETTLLYTSGTPMLSGARLSRN